MSESYAAATPFWKGPRRSSLIEHRQSHFFPKQVSGEWASIGKRIRRSSFLARRSESRSDRRDGCGSACVAWSSRLKSVAEKHWDQPFGVMLSIMPLFYCFLLVDMTTKNIVEPPCGYKVRRPRPCSTHPFRHHSLIPRTRNIMTTQVLGMLRKAPYRSWLCLFFSR